MIIEVHQHIPHRIRQGEDSERTWFKLPLNFYSDPRSAGLSAGTMWFSLCLLSLAGAANKRLIWGEISHLAALSRCTLAEAEERLKALALRSLVTLHEGDEQAYFTLVREGKGREGKGREENTNRANKAPKDFSPSDLVELWNAHGGELEKVQRLTEKRRAKILPRISEVPEKDYWAKTIARLAGSDFATGKNDRGWKASFDWFIANDTNHVKVAEGKYDNRGGGPKAQPTKAMTMEELDALIA